MNTIQKARAWVDSRAQRSGSVATTPRLFTPPYGGATYFGQAYRWEQVLHDTYWVFACIGASMREVAGSGMPNIGKIATRDPEEEAKVLAAVHTLIRRKSFPKCGGMQSAIGKRLAGNMLIEKGFKKSSVNRVLKLNPPKKIQTIRALEKALGGPKQHQDFEPYDDDHPAVQVFKRPNVHYVAYDLWAYHMLFKGLTGQVLWWVIRNDFGVPVEIWIIPTHWQRLETDGYGHPVSYCVQSPWGQMMHIPYEQVISFYDHSPLNIYEGNAVTQAIREWIDGYEAQVRARLAGFKNMGAPSIHIALGESYADPDEAFLARYYSKWASRFMGEDNYGKPLMTGPDIEVKQIGGLMTDVPFKDGEEQGRDMILGAFGVPKGVLGLEPTSDVSAYAPQRQFVRFRINPELKYISEVITEKIIKTIPGHEDGIFFFDDHVIDDPEQQLREIQALWDKGGQSPNEIRVQFGLEPWEHGGDDPVLNGAPVNWATGKDPEPELTAALRSQLDGGQAREYEVNQLGDGRWTVIDSDGNINQGPFDDETDAKIALSKLLGRADPEGSGGIEVGGANVDGIDPDLDKESLIGKSEDEEPAGPLLRWHKTHDGNLEARGNRKWRIERVLDRKGKLVSYKLHLDGDPHDESSALGILKEVAEKAEARDQPQPETVTKLNSGSGAAGGYTIPTNGNGHKKRKGMTTDVAAALRQAGQELQNRTESPLPMPGYGQIYAAENEVWYVGGDGDENDYAKLVEQTLREAYPGMGKFHYEAEAFPPEKDGWVKIYPSTTKHLLKHENPGDGGAFEHRDPNRKFTIAIDLHDTLCYGRGDGQGEYPNIGSPLDGAKEACTAMKEMGMRLIVCSVFDDIDQIRRWLDEHSIPFDYINTNPYGRDGIGSGKVDADVYVDNRGLHFKGDWDETVDKIEDRFKDEMQKAFKRPMAARFAWYNRRLEPRQVEPLHAAGPSTSVWSNGHDTPMGGAGA